MEQLNKYNNTGGYNPYDLQWGDEVIFPSTRKMSEFGNKIYNRYPARSVFLVPRAILHQYKNKKINVLDPFMGSGTTGVETILSGNISYATEMDPFARMVAEVSSTILSKDNLRELTLLFDNIIDSFETFTPVLTPNLTGIERWFDELDFIKLRKLRACISELAPPCYLDFMLIVFADSIKPVSKMERQSTKPYISSKYKKETKPVAESFRYSFKKHYDAISEMSETLGFVSKKPIVWLGDDATNFKTDKPIIDIAISSPPYINAFDYTQCIKVESALCGSLDNDIAKDLRNKQVGHSARKKIAIDDSTKVLFREYYELLLCKDPLIANTCIAYFNDIRRNLLCVYNTLKEGGEYHMIIGNSIIKGVEIPTHEIIGNIAESLGYKWFGYYKYMIKDHRTSIPRDKETSKMKYEHVIMLRK